jgi:hypothetical protein
MNTNDNNSRHLLPVVALFLAICSIYMLTYSGRIIYNDELQMLDATGSFVEYGDFKYDIALWRVLSDILSVIENDSQASYPVIETTIEHGSILAGAPFYALAETVPNMGLMHSTYLLNIFAGAAVCVLMFLYSGLLGYDYKVSLAAAFALGFCTVLWPYSRTFMREPLQMLLILASAYLLENARRTNGNARIYQIIGALILFSLVMLVKKELFIIFPTMFLIIMPDIPKLTTSKRFKYAVDSVLVLIIIAVFVSIYTNIVAILIPSPLMFQGDFVLHSDFYRDAMHGYLLSPGGSIWGTSPILLLAIPGAWLLLRQDKRRYLWVMIVTLLAFTSTHALSSYMWFGGATLPPRFLIPSIPFILICALPVFRRITELTISAPMRILAAIIVIYSLWWQLSGGLLSWAEYTKLLPPESNGLATWLPSIYRIEYLRPLLLTPQWFEQSLDFAWIRNNVYLWPLVFATITILCVSLLLRKPKLSARQNSIALIALPTLFLASTFFAIQSIYHDPAYLGNESKLHQIAAILSAEEDADDILIVNNPVYHHFLMNYHDFHSRVVILDNQPGERGSFEQSLQVISDEPADLISVGAQIIIDGLATKRDSLWLLMETGPFLPWSIRPVERYMNKYYYPIREFNTDATVRLLEYSTVNAPDVTDAPQLTTDLHFGPSIQLSGFTLAIGTSYAPGDILPISLYWQPDDVLEDSYTIAMFLVNADGAVVVQAQDSQPNGGFSLTNDWQSGQMVLDNRAVRIPSDLPSGEYRLWLRLYKHADGGLQHLPVTGETVAGDGDIGVLPVVIGVGTDS